MTIPSIKKHLPSLVSLLTFSILLAIISFNGSFGDEHENFVAGWFMSKGLMPFRDFFFHHAPLPFFISAILTWFSGQTFVVYRVAILIFHIITWAVLLTFTDKKIHTPIVISMIIIALMTPKLASYMFLADTFMAISLVAIIVLYASYVINQKPPSTQLFILITIYSFIGIWSSITMIIPFVIATIIFLLMISPTIKDSNQTMIIRNTAVFVAVHLIFPIYFFITGAFKEFIWSLFQYNNQYYFPLRLAENDTERNLGMLYRIINQFIIYISRQSMIIWDSAWVFTLTIKEVFHEYIFTHSVSLLLQNISVAFKVFYESLLDFQTVGFIAILLIITMSIRKGFVLFFASLVLIITLRPRTNGLFHLAPFFYVVVFLSALVMIYSIKTKKILHSLFSFATIILFIVAAIPQYHEQLTFDIPIIDYKYIERAESVTSKSSDGEKLLSLDGNPIIYQLSNRMPASRYTYYYPWFHQVDQIRHEVEQTIIQRQADVVYIKPPVEEFFAPELVQKVDSGYTPVKAGVYRITQR